LFPVSSNTIVPDFGATTGGKRGAAESRGGAADGRIDFTAG